MYDWILRFNRIIGRSLVGFVGLTLTLPVLAQQTFPPFPGSTYNARSFANTLDAKVGCLSALEDAYVSIPAQQNATNRYEVGTVYHSCDILYKNASNLYAYACSVEMRVINKNTNQTNSLKVVNCNNPFGSGSTISVSSNGFQPFTSTVFIEAQDCSNKPPLTSIRAVGGNGTGDICYQDCAYSVAIGYSGTWPSGKVTFDAISLGRTCNPSDSASTNEPLPPDSPPLDIPDKTPNPNPDPSDGTKNSSSGGGDCTASPVCSGDAIQCNILYQSWAARCNNTAGGSVGGPGSGGGNDTDLTGVENKLQTLINQNDELFNDNGQSWGVDDGDWAGLKATKTLSVDDLNTQGLGFPRSCNFFEQKTINVGVTSFTIDLNSTGVCNIFTWSGYLLVALASFAGCMILIRD